tara:strand:+ start:140 stop:367 length:228 start_codon:yes stop_codon:yes gene_type:complete
MLPRKLHLEQINRYHDMVESLSKDINILIDDNRSEEEIGELARVYYELTTDIGEKLDTFIESGLKVELDKYTLRD